MEKQKTINKEIYFQGIGLHTGQKVKIRLSPLGPNSGIIFVREDINPPVIIKADFYSLLDPSVFPRRTSIGKGGVNIHTIEHLMAAFAILGIDNIQVSLDGEEVPGMDGSALEFVEGIKKAGIVTQNIARSYMTIKDPLWIEEGDSNIAILPYPGFKISYTLNYDSSGIDTGFINVDFSDKQQREALAAARTFCLEREVEPLKKMGLGKGANFSNTLVITEKGVIKDNNLRVSDEFVKHKVLDLVGDLYLTGPIKGHIIAVKSGHSLNIKMLNKLRRIKEKSSSAGVGNTSGYVPQASYLDASEIMKVLPHRYPFLLVDRIVELEYGRYAVGIKNVTINDYFFQGHFPGKPVMPGVLIIEAMAQVGGVLMLSAEEHRGKLAFFLAADNVKFRKTVEPGDQLVIKVTVDKIRQRTGRVHTEARVQGKVACEADLMFALMDR